MRSTKNGGASTEGLAPRPPVLFIVDADRGAGIAIESALMRRFAPDYRVLSADSPEAGFEGLERLARRGEEVAVVAADLRLPGTDGIAFLERARALHRRAVRALLVAMDRRGTRIPFDELQSLQRATALGRIDFWAVKGWAAPKSCSTRRYRRPSPRGRGPTAHATRWSAWSASAGRRAATICATRSAGTPSRSVSTPRIPRRDVGCCGTTAWPRRGCPLARDA
jgi:CheY-like chemotaxis protein